MLLRMTFFPALLMRGRTRGRRSDFLMLAVIGTVLLPGRAEAQRPSRNAAPTRVAVFDSRVLIDSMAERASVESEFALDQAKARTMLREASDSLRATLDQFLKEESRLSPREREAGSLHLRARELLVEEMASNLDRVMEERRDQLREPLLQRIRAAVRVVREREGVALMIDMASAGGWIDADPAVDLTQRVLAELRAGRPTARPSGAPKPDASGSTVPSGSRRGSRGQRR
jgi:Skp family chaperone for outer membrane proteins